MACQQQLRIKYDKNKKVLEYELQCRGQCDDGKDCKPKSETDDKTHVTKEFCACKEGKGDPTGECYIVLYTVRNKTGDKIIEQYYTCEGKKSCPDKTKCAAKVVGRDQPDPDENVNVFVQCDCWPEDEVWPE